MMDINRFPAPIGFVQEFLVVANGLKMKAVEVHEGKLLFTPTHNNQRTAAGLARRIANRCLVTDLVHDTEFWGPQNFNVNQDRLNQLIDLRGWPEISRNDLNVYIMDYVKDGKWVVEMELTCE